LSFDSAHGQPACLFKQVQIARYGLGLLFRSQAGPQRIKCSCIFVRRTPACHKVVIEKEPPTAVPKILNHPPASFSCFTFPILGSFGMTEQDAHPLQILFRLIKQAVQTNGSKMMRCAAKRAKAERYIEAGLSHASVALVKIGG